jgi:hypothetical protein
MTYGVYTRDLRGVRVLGERGIDVCKQYCKDDCVVCSEKRIWCGWSISFYIQKWPRFGFYPRLGMVEFGFIGIKITTERYTWADKIVYDPKKESVVKQ